MIIRGLALALIILLAGGCASVDTSPSPAEVADPPRPPRPQPPPPPPPPPPPQTDAYLALCDGQIRNMEELLSPIVQDLSAQRILYAQNPSDEWRDCSGVFLRLSSYVAAACPEQQGALAARPGISRYVEGGNNTSSVQGYGRNSRSIAEWYAARGRFVPIYYDGVTSPGQIPPDLRRSRNLIRPGAVVWFSLDRPKASDGLSGLFVRNVSRGPHINHMATVTSVTRDENGDVVQYEMFHGRSTGKVASVTKAHFWTWPTGYLGCSDRSDRSTCTKEYPSLGYWKQYLVGIGTLLPEPQNVSAN